MITNELLKPEPAVEHYLGEYNRIKKNLAGCELPWLQQLRAQALTQFTQQGFPTFRDEDWKYTNIAPLTKQALSWAIPQPNPTVPDVSFDLPYQRLVFVNGHFSAKLSKLDAPTSGIQITNLAKVLNEQPGLAEKHLQRIAANHPASFTALNTAFIHDGAYIHIPRNTSLSQPVHLLFLNSEEASFSSLRNLIVLEENSQATILESYCGNSSHFTNSVTELVLDKNASCEHYTLLKEDNRAFHINTLQVLQQRQSRLTAYSLALAGGLTRSDVNVTLADEYAECHLNGLYLANGKQHVDHHTLIDHAKPHGTSRENYKGVLADRARAVFNGKVIVRPGAQKTDAEQSNKNLLLSNDAEVDTKPQLEIFNDDVRCTHGAAVGQLSEDALFYLRSRGIDESAARNLLVYAFVREIVERIPLEPLRQQLESYISGKL